MTPEKTLPPFTKNVLARIRSYREFKHQAAEEEINSQGRRNREIVKKIEIIVPKLKKHSEPWVQTKWALLKDYLSFTSFDKVDQLFQRGLANSLVQQQKLRDDILTDDSLRTIAYGFSLDFVHTLLMSKRHGVNPKIGIRLAGFSHRFSPEAFYSLKEKFPDKTDWHITTAMSFVNPEEELRNPKPKKKKEKKEKKVRIKLDPSISEAKAATIKRSLILSGSISSTSNYPLSLEEQERFLAKTSCEFIHPSVPKVKAYLIRRSIVL